MQIKIRLTTLIAMLLLTTSWAVARPLQPLSELEALARKQELKHSPLNPATVVVNKRLEIDGCQIDHTTFDFVDPKTGEGNSFTVSVYHPTAGAGYPAVLVLPTVLGQSVIEEVAAFRFCKANFVAFIADVNINEAPVELPDWTMSDRSNRVASLKLQTLLDYVQIHPQVNAQKIGALGLSLGAWSLAMLSTMDERIRAVVTVCGGGNMPAILSYSQNRFPTALREMRMDFLNDHDPLDYENNLRQAIRFDPIYLSKIVNPKKYFMIVNTTDVAVPTENQFELWDGFGRPDHIEMRGLHRDVIMESVAFHFDEILTNINSRL